MENTEKKDSIGQLLPFQDSLEIGTPGKGGAIKVYGDYSDKEGFKKKIDIALELRDYTAKQLDKPVPVAAHRSI